MPTPQPATDATPIDPGGCEGRCRPCRRMTPLADSLGGPPQADLQCGVLSQDVGLSRKPAWLLGSRGLGTRGTV